MIPLLAFGLRHAAPCTTSALTLGQSGPAVLGCLSHMLHQWCSLADTCRTDYRGQWQVTKSPNPAECSIPGIDVASTTGGLLQLCMHPKAGSCVDLGSSGAVHTRWVWQGSQAQSKQAWRHNKKCIRAVVVQTRPDLTVMWQQRWDDSLLTVCT